MRILLVSHKFPPHSLGGVEIYTHNLAKSLHARHQVAAFYRHDDDNGSPLAEHDGEVALPLTEGQRYRSGEP